MAPSDEAMLVISAKRSTLATGGEVANDARVASRKDAAPDVSQARTGTAQVLSGSPLGCKVIGLTFSSRSGETLQNTGQ